MPITYNMTISIWQREDGIHISFENQGIPDVTGITTVNDNPVSRRGHPHLYNQLKKILIKNEMWQE